MKKNFSIGEAFGFGWDTMKRNIGFFILLLFVYAVLYYVPTILADIIGEFNVGAGLIISLADGILTIIISIGIVKIALLFCDNEKGKISDIFLSSHLFFKFLGGSILYSLIVIAGLLLFIIPGIIWSIKFWFFDYFIVDEEVGPIEALKKSSAITKGVKMELFVFFLAMVGINIIGALVLLIGLFVTIPVTMIAAAYVYRKLLAQEKAAAEPECV